MKTTPLRPHKVLGQTGLDGDTHALTLTEGPYAGIIFSYTSVSFKEEKLDNEDKLKISFEYLIHDNPYSQIGYNKEGFEQELGDFIVELLYYGLERDKLGFIDEQNREDYPFQPNSQ